MQKVHQALPRRQRQLILISRLPKGLPTVRVMLARREVAPSGQGLQAVVGHGRLWHAILL